MSETPGSYAGESIPQPSLRLTRAEQWELLLWHPLFTGKCPQCGEAIAQTDISPQQWHCRACSSGGAKYSDQLTQASQLNTLRCLNPDHPTHFL